MKLLNRKKVEQIVNKQMRDIVNKKVIQATAEIQVIVKETIDDLDAVESGLLKERTTAKIRSSSKAIKVIINTNNVEYAKFVYFGLGTNRKIGARKFNLISARKLKQFFETGRYDRVFMKGGQNKKGTSIKTAKKKNISQRRERIFKAKFKIGQKQAKKLGILNQLKTYQKLSKKGGIKRAIKKTLKPKTFRKKKK